MNEPKPNTGAAERKGPDSAGAEAVATLHGDREIQITREVDAPRELVWEVWTRPEHVVNWWGPDGFSTTVHEMNVAPGGRWRFIMHGPDGVDYPNEIVFDEIEPPQRLVYSHSGAPDGVDVHFQVTVTFESLGARTRVIMRTVSRTAAELDLVIREHGAVEGGIQHLGRLAAYLARVS